MYNTITESWIIKEYQKRDIVRIQDLCIKKVSKSFNIGLIFHRYRSECIHEMDFGVIYVNELKPHAQQRVEFFHEMGHVLKHYGDQKTMPDTFMRLQEQQAETFSLYAAMPLHILEPLLDNGISIKEITDLFDLPEYFVRKRLAQLDRLYLRRRSYKKQKLIEDITITYRQSYDPSKWSDETWRIMDQLKKQTNKEVINHVGLLRRNRRTS
ncbi:ImmA/IrrE family metallo-endopeptidase [Evansella tamaricis]|uniref:ImmA/IrrE family metallo-endopeptidase n=1 Tax=Evansella tamaricis TaxID=2069301 RepID=A0ABS6JBQ8_9BACI|nr:ImmA/IrrE family metallo-endopeptidase [Evansella tamaricis]MBU9711119.1 ImmA/IrrE family metallo-endopeptidase [Evansella tamaricis]